MTILPFSSSSISDPEVLSRQWKKKWSGIALFVLKKIRHKNKHNSPIPVASFRTNLVLKKLIKNVKTKYDWRTNRNGECFG